MAKNLDKSAALRLTIFAATCVYLAYGVYFMVYGLNFSLDLITNNYVYNLVTKDPWWWIALYYGSEGVAGSVAIVLRAAAGVFGVYAAYRFWRSGSATPAVQKNVSRALLFEAGFFLALIPSIIAAFAYNLTDKYLFYFDHTPELILLYGTAIPCLAIVLTAPPLLLKLRAKINAHAAKEEILRWSSLAGLGYLFVVFWFNYTMLWAACMVPYPRAFQVYGLEFLLQPTNLASFAVTVFGLLAVALAALFTLRPALKLMPQKVNLTALGAVMVGFSGYFIFTTLYYYLTGGYAAHPSVWYEVIGPLHNPNLWALALVLVGAALMVYSRAQRRQI
ncbi:MAG: hypothetical protein NWE93_06410 [Candidatus Bathyarchaeota archaeon]|nr:hypothetical protein [Candidatus Bathyarchaeota archaeon]